MRETIVDKHKIMQSKRPILERKSRSMKHGADCIGDGAMRSLCKTDRTGSVGRSNFDFIASFGEEFMNFLVTAKLATTVKPHTTISGVGFAVGDEGCEKVDRRLLVAASRHFDAAAFAISDDHITRFTT